MHFRNTSRYDTREVRRLVQHGLADLPLLAWDIDSIAIWVKNNNKNPYNGLAYRGVPTISPFAKVPGVKYLITIRIGGPERFPVSNFIRSKGHCYGGLKSPYVLMADWRECLVAITAHEGGHVAQYVNKWPTAEWQCEEYAKRAVNRYRRGLGMGPIPERHTDLGVTDTKLVIPRRR